MSPPPQENFDLSDSILDPNIRVDMEALQFVNSLQLALLRDFFFLVGEGDLVLGETSQRSPLLLNRTLYTVM